MGTVTHPTDEEIRTQGDETFAIVHCREVVGLGVGPDGAGFKVDASPVPLSEREREQTEVWTPERPRITLLQLGEDGRSVP